jgi:hypothetical protein
MRTEGEAESQCRSFEPGLRVLRSPPLRPGLGGTVKQFPALPGLFCVWPSIRKEQTLMMGRIVALFLPLLAQPLGAPQAPAAQEFERIAFDSLPIEQPYEYHHRKGDAFLSAGERSLTPDCRTRYCPRSSVFVLCFWMNASVEAANQAEPHAMRETCGGLSGWTVAVRSLLL